MASSTIEAELPAIVSVTDQSGEARYPRCVASFAAKKKPVETWTLADLGIDGSAVGLDAAWSKVLQTSPRPAKEDRAASSMRKNGTSAFIDFLTAGKYHLRRQRRCLEVLVVAEHVILTYPSQPLEPSRWRAGIGEPVAVVFGDTDDTHRQELGEYGATRVRCRSMTLPWTTTLSRPGRGAWPQIAGRPCSWLRS